MTVLFRKNSHQTFSNHYFSWHGSKATLTHLHNTQQSTGPGGRQQSVPGKRKLSHEPAWPTQPLSYISCKSRLHCICPVPPFSARWVIQKDKAKEHDCQDRQLLTWVSSAREGIASSDPGRMWMSWQHQGITAPYPTHEGPALTLVSSWHLSLGQATCSMCCVSTTYIATIACTQALQDNFSVVTRMIEASVYRWHPWGCHLLTKCHYGSAELSPNWRNDKVPHPYRS